MTKKFVKKFLSLLLIVGIFLSFNNSAHADGEGEYCLKIDFGYQEGFTADDVSSITINGVDWVHDETYNATPTQDHKLWTIVILAGKHGDDYPFASTPGGFDDYGTYDARPNHDENPNVLGDEYIITVTINDNWTDKGDPNSEPRVCGQYGINITKSGPPITEPDSDENPSISLSISGAELEYHYVADKPEEDDVARFKIGINNGVWDNNNNFVMTDGNGLIPFRFGNVTFKDGIEPPNATGASTTNDITDYHYSYNHSGTVEFCVMGGADDNYTKILISGKSNNESHDYADQAPHTQVEVFEHIIGRASQFCITGVPYDPVGYNIVVEGERQPEGNTVAGFGWSHLSQNNSPDLPIEEEGDFAHGTFDFVRAEYTDIDNVYQVFDNVQSYNGTKYHGTGEIYEWRNGDRNYTDEDRRQAWGEALVPSGTTLTVKVNPDPGYQLVAFTETQNGFAATENPGEYIITVNKDNLYDNDHDSFRLHAVIQPTANSVQVDTNAVDEGAILTNQEVANGTIKLEVNDAAGITEDQITAFENTANGNNEGFEVAQVLDLSLYNAIYQGGKQDNNGNYLSWDTEMNNLQDNAIISLKLNGDMSGKEVALVHEDHDGNNNPVYTIVDSNFNSETNTLEFGTKTFSNYAIVVKSTNNPDEPQQPGENQARIIYNTRSNDNIPDAIINKGEKAPQPRDPEHEDGLQFEGWYTTEACNEEYDFNQVVNVDTLEIFAKWGEKEDGPEGPEPVRDTPYTLEDENHNIISFMEEEGHTYNFEMIDYLSFTKEEVMAAAQISSEVYDLVFGGVKSQAEAKGTFLFFFNIRVYENVEPDPNNPDDNGQRDIHEGPFTIKIKMTDELKKYTNFKMYNVNDETFEMDNEPLTFEVSEDGNYLVGIVKHLSLYTMVADEKTEEEPTPDVPGNGDTPDNAKTNDNIMLYVVLLSVSVLGLSILPIKYFKNKKSDI